MGLIFNFWPWKQTSDLKEPKYSHKNPKWWKFFSEYWLILTFLSKYWLILTNFDIFIKILTNIDFLIKNFDNFCSFWSRCWAKNPKFGPYNRFLTLKNQNMDQKSKMLTIFIKILTNFKIFIKILTNFDFLMKHFDNFCSFWLKCWAKNPKFGPYNQFLTLKPD